MTTFQEAAASYFGLAETNLRKTEVFTDAGEVLLVFEIPLNKDDILGIADRLRAMVEQALPEPVQAETRGWTREELREQYNALSPAERSQYGAFSRYEAWRRGEGSFQVQAKIELPAHVYLNPAEATEQQKVMAIGRDEKGNYAVTMEDLTSDQYAQAIRDGRIASAEALSVEKVAAAFKVPAHLIQDVGAPIVDYPGAADQLRAGYAQRTVAAMERLNGTDGKPTSNADDFGGVPG